MKESSLVGLKQFTLDMLKKNDVSKYFIEYNGYFSNHVSHVLIALYRIGASEKYFESYVEKHKKEHVGINARNMATAEELQQLV